MTEHMSPIPSRIYNAAVGGHVCGPEDVDFGQKVVHLIKYDRAGNEVSFESQVTQANKIYVIHDDFTLSSNVTIPANCVLEFDGGSIVNASGNSYIIYTNNTYFKGNGYCAVALNGQFQYDEIDIFGVRPANSAAENSANIAKFMQSVSPKVYNRDNAPNNYIRFGQGVYNFAEPITIIGAGGVYGAGDGATHLIFANSDGLRFNMNIPGSYMGLDISGFYIESNGNAIDLCYEHGSHTGTNIHNVTIQAPNGAGITTTIKAQNIYGCNFENIRFHYCKYCMSNMSLILNTCIKNCIDFSCRIWFYNCCFQETQFIGGNVGWGHHQHFIYNDKSWKDFNIINYSIFVYNCNFEEFESNIVVIKKPTDYPSDTPIFNLTFVECDFNDGNVSKTGYEIYKFKDDYSDLETITYTSYTDYYPIIGFEINPKFINCKSSIKNDNNEIINIPLLAYIRNYSCHNSFNEVGAIIYVSARFGSSYLTFVYNGKKIVSLNEMLNNPVIASKFTKIDTFYLGVGTRDSIVVNDTGQQVDFAFSFDQQYWASNNSFRFVSKNSNIQMMQGFAGPDTNMNKSSVYNAIKVGGIWFNTTTNKPLFCTGSGWVDATGTSV